MAERPTQKFDAHITPKSKKKGWLIFLVMFGVPLGVVGTGY